MRPDGPGGGQHHQASARLAAGSGDAVRRSDAVSRTTRAGAAPGSPRKVYKVGFLRHWGSEPTSGTKLLPVDVSAYDPLLGKTYMEIGAEGRAMHKCQGMGQLLPLPGTFAIRYQLIATTLSGGIDRTETGADRWPRFDGAGPCGLRRLDTAVAVDRRSRRDRWCSHNSHERTGYEWTGRQHSGARSRPRRSARARVVAQRNGRRRQERAVTRSACVWRRRSGSSTRRSCLRRDCDRDVVG